VTLFAGTPQPQRIPAVGDRVYIVQKPESPAVDLTGWVLNLPEGKIRVAHKQCDDGRPDPPEGWWRATFALSQVDVVVVP